MSNCCPQGYTYNAVSGECEQITSTIAVLTGNPTPLIKGSCGAYGNLGAVFYADITALTKPITASVNSVNFPNPVGINDYAVLLEGNLTTLPIQNAVPVSPSNYTWGYPFPPPFPVPVPCQTGRLNIVGLWVADLSLREWIGITTCVTIPQTKTYYIGIAGDDVVKLTINGQLTLDLEGAGWNFTTWKIFPITLNAGNNTFLLEGLTTGSSSAMAFEIYDATLAQLVAVTTPIALAPYILFSSSSLGGRNITNGTTIGYQCGPVCGLNICNNPPTCDCISAIAPVPCCYSLTNCVTGVILNTQTDLSLSVGSIVKIDTSNNCYIVSLGNIACLSAVPVMILKTFVDCKTCVQVCYKLIDCSSNNAPLITNTDLSLYVGQIIQIASCPGVCWEVFINVDCIGSQAVDFVKAFTTCNLCLGIFTPTIVLKNRSVTPNYGNSIGNCSYEYMEKVNCSFAEQSYSRIIIKRFGIKSCEEDLYDKWWIKKQLLMLNLIEDPNACIIPCVPIACDPPTPPPLPPAPLPIACPAPTNVTVTFVYIDTCAPVASVVPIFTFNNPVGNP